MLSFKDEDNRKMPVDAEKNKLQNCYLGCFEILKVLEIWRFIFLFLQKNPQNFKILKTGINVLEELLKYVCTKFQVIPFINDVFIAFWMWKKATFQGIWK